MSLKSIIAALAVVGSSSVALAAPVNYSVPSATIHSQRYIEPPISQLRPYRPVVVDDDCNNTTLGGDSSGYNGPIGTKVGFGWTALTQPTRIDRGREFFHIGTQAGRFTTLKLENVRGSSEIQQVLVEFANGQAKVVKLNKCLDMSNPCIEINLGHNRAISRIVVYGSTASHSAYQILAA